MGTLELPPICLNPNGQLRDDVQQTLPCLRDLFPNIDFVEPPHLDLIPIKGPTQRYVSHSSRGTWPTGVVGIELHGPTSATPARGRLSLNDSYPAPYSPYSLYGERPRLGGSSPALLTSVNPSGVTSPPNCFFDILRPNRYSARLEHIASSRTQWTSIPRFTPNCDSQGMGVFPQMGTTPFGSDHQSGGKDHMITTSHVTCHPNGASSLNNDICTNSADAHVMSARIDSAQAQAVFEAEIVRSNTRKSRRRRPQHLNSLSFTGGLPSPPLSSSSSPISPITDKNLSNPKPLTTHDSNRTTPPRRKKPCDVERNHICPRCGRTFNRPSSLRMHGRTHTGFRPFICPFERCGRSFTVSSNMRRHCRTHCSEGTKNAA